MNDNYYQMDICFNFESDSDEKAIDYFLKNNDCCKYST